MNTLFLSDFEKSSLLQPIYLREFWPIGARNDDNRLPETVLGAIFAHIVKVLSAKAGLWTVRFAPLGQAVTGK